MAKNKYNSTTGKSHVGTIVAITASVLAVAIGASVIGVGTSGFKDWGFGRWFPKTETVAPAPEASAGGNAVITDSEGQGICLMSAMIPEEEYALYGIDAQSVENVFSLSVTYTPEDTTYKATTFTAKFKNPDSAWAKGKAVTDYVKITSTGDTTATLQVLQPFSEQIIVTAANTRTPSIKTTSTVDYVGTHNIIVDSFFTEWTDGSGDASLYQDTTTPIINGTVAPDAANAVTLTFDTAWIKTGMAAKGYTDFKDSVTYTFNCAEGDSIGDNIWEGGIYNILLKAGNRTGSWSDTANADYRQAISQVVLDSRTPEEMNADSSTIFTNVTLTTHRTYNGVKYDDVVLYNSECVLKDWGIFEVVATGLTNGSPSIIAG